MPVDAGIALVALGTAAYGYYQKNQAQKQANANVMPTYTIPQAEMDNQRLAQTFAGQGMNANSQTAYQNQNNEGLSTTISGMQRSGADPNAMGAAYNNFEKGNQTMAIYDDQARMQNMRNLMSQNSSMAAYNDKAWQLNSYAPWANKAQALAGQMQGDQQLITSGLNTATSAGMGAAKNLAAGDSSGTTGWTNPGGTHRATNAPIINSNPMGSGWNSPQDTGTGYQPWYVPPVA